MSHDEKCAELAQHFLNDQPGATLGDVTDLAEEIQIAIEWWLDWRGITARSTAALSDEHKEEK
jgi:hypothetical protein